MILRLAAVDHHDHHHHHHQITKLSHSINAIGPAAVDHHDQLLIRYTKDLGRQTQTQRLHTTFVCTQGAHALAATGGTQANAGRSAQTTCRRIWGSKTCDLAQLCKHALCATLHDMPSSSRVHVLLLSKHEVTSAMRGSRVWAVHTATRIVS
jgi:hypothetical protein